MAHRRDSDRRDRRLDLSLGWWSIWIVLAICWVVLAAALAFGWFYGRGDLPERHRELIRRVDRPLGTHTTCTRVEPPLVLRLADGRVVTPQGIALPRDPALADDARNVAREFLVVVKGRLYVVPGGAEESPAKATIFLPRADAGENDANWYPHPGMRTLAGRLVELGLARVDSGGVYGFREGLRLLEHDARRHGRGLWANR